MGAIHLLSPLLQNQIAAGEVVERPASVIKELLENALDAGSSRIRIAIEEGGIARILIEDNGSGILKEDLPLTCLRYATSKITTAEDLNHIASYGFRGEALASIASVAQVTIQTKTADSLVGYAYSVLGGHERDMQEIAMTQGTKIIIEDLFFNTPARKKYLKSATTEASHITALLTKYALILPHIDLSYYHNGKEIFSLRPVNTPEERLLALIGKDIAPHLVPVFYEGTTMTLRGFVAKPSYASGKRKQQFLFLNGRPIQNPLLTKAVQDAYYRLVEGATVPFFSLDLRMDPEYVDVNVHPRKLEVRFAEEQTLYRIVYGAIQKALSEQDLSPTPSYPALSSSSTPSVASSPSVFRGAAARSPYARFTAYTPQQSLPTLAPSETFAALAPEEHPALYTLIGQLHQCYLLVKTPSGFAIIDQHAAHERVLYERFSQAFLAKERIAQPLLLPLSITLPPSLFAELEEVRGDLELIGFSFSDLGNRTIALSQVPHLLQDKDITESFLLILQDILDHVSTEKAIMRRHEKLIVYTACRSAVKFGDPLSPTMMESLLRDYEQLPTRHTCPHGRPSIKEMSLSELSGYFHRNG